MTKRAKPKKAKLKKATPRPRLSASDREAIWQFRQLAIRWRAAAAAMCHRAMELSTVEEQAAMEACADTYREAANELEALIDTR